MNNKFWFNNLSKQLRIFVFLVTIASCFFIDTEIGKAQSTTTTTSNLTTTNLNNWSQSGGSIYVSPDGSTATYNWQGGTLTSPNIDLNSTLSLTEIQKGFTTNYGVDIKFWCSNNIYGYCENPTGTKDTVVMTQQLTGSDGTIITQNRVITEGYNPSFVNYKDTIIINQNSLTNYTISLKLYGIDNGYWAGYWGPTVSNPSLTVDYTKDIQLSTTQTTELSQIENSLDSLITEDELKAIYIEEFAKVGLTEADVDMSGINFKEMANEINTSIAEENKLLFIASDDQPTTKESSNVNSSSETITTTSSTTTEKTETSTVKSTSSEDTKTEGSQTKTSSSENISNEKGSTTASGTFNTSNVITKDEKISINVKTALDKVEKELKNIGDKTKAIQEIKIDGIKAGAPSLSVYENRSFYEPKYYNGVPNPDFYLQADIAQKPVYANVTLSAYTNNDPIGKQQAAMQQIQDEMNDIIIQLEELKRNR